MKVQNCYQPLKKNNRLKNQNNRLFTASIVQKGHFVSFGKSRKSLVLRGILKWIPKNPKSSNDQSDMKGPKFFKGSNLVI